MIPKAILGIKREYEIRGLFMRIVWPKHCIKCNSLTPYQFHTILGKLYWYHCAKCLEPLEQLLIRLASNNSHVIIHHKEDTESNPNPLIPIFENNIFKEWRQN